MAAERIREGEVVCIFAEGQITRIGQLLPFRRGLELIMKDVEAPVVPVCLDGVWGSIFSFERGRFFGKLPRSIPYPVTVSYGEPISAIKSYILTPFTDERHVELLVRNVLDARERITPQTRAQPGANLRSPTGAQRCGKRRRSTPLLGAPRRKRP